MSDNTQPERGHDASVIVSPCTLERRIAEALEASNVAPENAASVARALTLAEVDGRKGHGLSRVPSYAAQARSGKVDGHAHPTAEARRAGALLVDAAHGFAYPALDLAIARLPAMARETGIAAAAITRSHHFGVAGHTVERLADQGLVALVFGNTPAAMAPWGGRRALLGTNPIAFAAPRPDAAPLVIDLALSHVARGHVMKAAQKGEPIPGDWAFDAEGRPTTDAHAALQGTMRPMGGAKGAALALAVECLAVGLTGAHFAFEASSFFTADGPPPGVGQLLLALDAAAFAGADVLAERMGTIMAAIAAEPGARIPGEGRIAARARAEKDGVAVDAALLAEVVALANG